MDINLNVILMLTWIISAWFSLHYLWSRLVRYLRGLRAPSQAKWWSRQTATSPLYPCPSCDWTVSPLEGSFVWGFLWANDALDQVSDKMSAATISWQRKSAGSLAGSHLPSVDGQQKMICRLSPLPDPNLPPTRHSLSSSLPARKRVQAVRCQTQDSRKWEQISSNDFFSLSLFPYCSSRRVRLFW